MLVLHVIESLRQGGKERQLIELVRGLQDHVDNVILVLSEELYYAHDLTEPSVPIRTLIRRRKNDWKPALAIYREIVALRPDIVHVWDSLAAMYAAAPARLLGVRVVNGMIRNAPINLRVSTRLWRRAQFTFRMSHIVLANSHAGLKAYRVTGNKARCIHNGFDFRRLDHLSPETEVRDHYRLGAGPIIGMVAAFSPRKDHKTFLEAAQSIAREWPDVRFVAAGDGATLEHFRHQIPPNLRERISLPGAVRDVESLINVFTIGVLATNARIHGEGIPNAVMEYMGLAKPVVATESGGTRELVIDGTTGFLVRPGDPEDMFRRLATLLSDPRLGETMGCQGRKVIEQSFSLASMVTAYCRLYGAIIRSSHGDRKKHVA